MNQFQKYNDYKSSGVEWLGEVPRHWEVKKITHVFDKIGSGTTPTAGVAKYYENGELNWLQTGDLTDGFIETTNKKITQKAFDEFSTLKIYPKGSLVVAMYGATIGKVGYLNIETATNQACCVLSNPNNFFTKFGFYWFMGAKSIIVSMGYGGGQPNISQDLIKSLRLPVPPIEEQTAIAQYLDQKTAQLDTAIAQKQRMIELLKERRQILIHRAVTQGLDPSVKMKDSGVEWIGSVPEHWAVEPIKYSLHGIIDCEHSTAPFVDEKDYFVVRTSNVKNGELTFEEAKYTHEKGYKQWTKRGVPKAGDVLLTREAPAGEACLVPSDTKICLGQRMVWLKINRDKLHPQLAIYLIYSKLGRTYIDYLSAGSTVLHFNMSDIKNIPIISMPIEEQNLIVDFIESANQKLATAIRLKESEIAKLKEYKGSLINSVVTGKVRVV